jgi:hypothetical protein
MPSKEPGFAERLQTAAKAKKAKLDKIRAAAPQSGPAPTAPDAAKLEADAARRSRTAQRKDADRAGAEKRAAERAAEDARRAQAVLDDKARREAERVAAAEAEVARAKDQKAARDAKYAARKARQR